MKTVIRSEGLHKTYDESKVPVKALNGVELAIQAGEFTAIVGPSGSGKSTLLNIVGGLDRPSEGKIFVGETDMASLSENQLIKFRLQNIGFVFQAYNLIPVLTAEENVGFIMQLQGQAKKDIKERVKTLLESVGLGDRLHNRPNELSGGQQQRVAVARALASKPQFVLADEPTANLDSKSTENLLDIMMRLNQEEGITFVFSTHDQRVVNRARRVITLEDGKIVSDVQK